MMSHGTVEFLRSEAHGFTGARRFTCPRCKRERNESCVRPSGSRQVRTHPEREALWRAYQFDAPLVLAWLEEMCLPWLRLAIEDYLVAGRRPQRRAKDIEIAQRRLDEAKLLLGGVTA